MGRRAPEVAGRPIAATAPDDRGRCSSADGGQGGRRDGGGGRHRAAQCVHCALAGLSARGGGRDGGGRRPARRRLWKTGGSVRALAVTLPAAATVAAAALELRNARIALWTDVPRGATVATVRGRRPARRRHGKTSGGIRALAVTWSAAATVAAAVPELRNAHIAPWQGVPRGASVATARGRRPARRRLGKNRRRCSSAAGDLVGGRDGGGRRARAAQCAHCALAGCSARGGGRDGSRAAARAATAWENQRRHSGAGGDPVGRRDGGGRRAQAAQCAHCALAG